MTFEQSLLTIPGPWRFTHLMALDPGYQCNLRDDAFAVSGTGDTPLEALAAALANIGNELYLMPLYIPGEHAAPILRTSTDIMKLFISREPIDRRL